MKVLHTSDWHVGKVLRGRSRLEEQKQVLAEIVTLARAHDVDAVLVAGDLYDHAVPNAAAQRLVTDTLLDLAQAGIQVIAIAGNHDHAEGFEANRRLLGLAGVTLSGHFRVAGRGGVVSFDARSSGAPVDVAVMPFISTRYVVRAMELARPQAENSGAYDAAVRELVDHLTTAMRDDAVRLFMTHLTILNGRMGGGERQSQSVFDYVVPATVFPPDLHYVALGHLHRRQQLTSHTQVHYSGAPLAVDFGEQDNVPQVLLVEATPGTPAKVTELPVRSARTLLSVTGGVEELVAGADTFGDAYLRVTLTEAATAAARDALGRALPNLLELRLDPAVTTARPRRRDEALTRDATAQDLFDRYCADTGVTDRAVGRLFARLLDVASGAPGDGPDPGGLLALDVVDDVTAAVAPAVPSAVPSTVPSAVPGES